jgi:hypothetical protein
MMTRFFLSLALLASMAGCVTPVAGPIVSPELLTFYKDADAYQSSAASRLCADPSLTPRFEALRQRLERAKAKLVARYGSAQVESVRATVVSNGALCADKAAAAKALSGFETALANFESALR